MSTTDASYTYLYEIIFDNTYKAVRFGELDYYLGAKNERQ